MRVEKFDGSNSIEVVDTEYYNFDYNDSNDRTLTWSFASDYVSTLQATEVLRNTTSMNSFPRFCTGTSFRTPGVQCRILEGERLEQDAGSSRTASPHRSVGTRCYVFFVLLRVTSWLIIKSLCDLLLYLSNRLRVIATCAVSIVFIWKSAVYILKRIVIVCPTTCWNRW